MRGIFHFNSIINELFVTYQISVRLCNFQFEFGIKEFNYYHLSYEIVFIFNEFVGANISSKNVICF